jgi:hypothetical protein
VPALRTVGNIVTGNDMQTQVWACSVCNIGPGMLLESLWFSSGWPANGWHVICLNADTLLLLLASATCFAECCTVIMALVYHHFAPV